MIRIDVDLMGFRSHCHKHENNQDKRISKGHEPTMTKVGLVLNPNMKLENFNIII